VNVRWQDDYGTQLAGLYALNALVNRHDANASHLSRAGAGVALVQASRDEHWKKNKKTLFF
jgi:hypothetical protein